MAASNFYVKNASVYYAISTEFAEQLISGEDMILDELLREKMSKLGAKYEPDREYIHGSSRNYPEYRIGVITYECEFPYGSEKIYITVSVEIILRGGYYGDAVLDWEVSELWEDNGTGYAAEDAKTLMDNVLHEYWNVYVDTGYGKFGNCDSDGCEAFYELTKEAYERLAEHMQNTVDEVVSKIIKSVEEVYKEVSTPMRVAAKFSNGETIYEPINKED